MRNLYEQFRDGVIEDVIAGLIPQGGSMSPYDFLSKDGAKHIGRLQTIALIRRFMHRIAIDLPGAFYLKERALHVEPTFPEFAKTHKEMGSNSEEMRAAWVAMVGMKDQ